MPGHALQTRIVSECLSICDEFNGAVYHRHPGVIRRVAKAVEWFTESKIANYVKGKELFVFVSEATGLSQTI
jgi:hypothetical protein